MKLKQRLIAEREDLIIEQEAILGGEERELTDDEKSRDSEINARVGEIDKQLEVVKRREENTASQAKYTEWMNGSQTKAASKVDVKPAWEKDTEKRGFKHQQEFLQAILATYRTRKMDERLNGLMATAGSDENMTISDPYGGFMVPVGFSPDMLRIRPEGDPIGALTTRVPMANPALKMPARTESSHATSVAGGLTVARKLETASATASRMAIHQVELVAHSLFGLSYTTEELLQDSAVSWAAILEQGFSDAFIGKIVDERINGSGVGEYLGVLNSDALVEVAKESSQTAATLKYANFAKMMSRQWNYGRSVWLANHDCLPEIMTIENAAGQQLWQPNMRESVPSQILGRPLYLTEYCQTLGAVGDILLVDWAEYLEGIYQPMQSAESIHVRFVEHERAFKFSIRNAGVPWWKGSITPAKSTSTLSAYVALAVRA